MLTPESSTLLSNMSFLSRDGVSYSFDHRRNGYARGEGVIVIIIKPISLAVQDHDVIRAVIRSTLSNQDGRTPGLTQPSAKAQEQLIRDVYRRIDLDFASTRYVEAHGKCFASLWGILAKSNYRNGNSCRRSYRDCSHHEGLWVLSLN